MQIIQCVVFWDLKKAFDTLSSSRNSSFVELGSKGQQGLNHILLGKNRKLQLTVNVVISVRQHVGFLKGSILGPLLFILYINSLSPMLTVLKAQRVCGRHHLNECSRRRQDTLQVEVNSDVNKIQPWLKVNTLTLQCNCQIDGFDSAEIF